MGSSLLITTRGTSSSVVLAIESVPRVESETVSPGVSSVSEVSTLDVISKLSEGLATSTEGVGASAAATSSTILLDTS